MAFYGFVITEAGNRLLAQMVAGDTLEITKVVMEKGTAASAEAARLLTAPIDPGPNGTSTIPIVDGNAVHMIVEYRSDLNGGLAEGFWIGGFAIFARTDTAPETMIYYGSLGDAKQFVAAHAPGTAPDVRRYPTSITVTSGVEVDVNYPAEAWMTADDVAAYFNGTLKPDLMATLEGMLSAHDANAEAHPAIRYSITQAAAAAATAQSTAEAAGQAAAAAQGTANAAGSAAQAAQATANNAVGLAETAQTSANAAATLAQEAKALAENSRGGCVLQITFDSAFSGRPFTVSDGAGDNHAGNVPAGLMAEVTVRNVNTAYTIQSTNQAGTTFTTIFVTGPFFGQYQTELTTFSATLNVTTKAGAEVVATYGGFSYSATANASGLAVLAIKRPATYTVTATLSGQIDTKTIAVTTNGGTYALTLVFISSVLNDNTWAKIKEVSDAGQGANYWAVGDTKDIVINGTVGNTVFSNLAVKVFIIGFNHNSAREGNNRIHFQIGKIGTVNAALVDANYSTAVSTAGYLSMNATNINTGGWNGSQMRANIMGGGTTPASPKGNSLLAALPADLRAVMKACTKYTDNTGGGNNTASYVTSTTEYLFLLSEWEYRGVRSYANAAEQNYQAQYDFYKAGNPLVKYKHDALGTAVFHWCRSPWATNATYFCNVANNGVITTTAASYSYGMAPGFCA